MCLWNTNAPPLMASSKDDQGQKTNILIPVGRSCHKKCSCAIWKPLHSLFKLLARFKVFKKRVKLQGQGHMVKNNGTLRKILSQGILMLNIKALALTVKKLLARLKFQRGGQNDRMTKTICPTFFDLGGIKNIYIYTFQTYTYKTYLKFVILCWGRSS